MTGDLQHDLDDLVERLRDAGVRLTAAQDDRIALHEEWLDVRAEWSAKLRTADARVEAAHDELAALARGGSAPTPTPTPGDRRRRSVRDRAIEWFDRNPDAVVGTLEIAQALGCRRDTARVRLHELVTDGVLRRVGHGRFVLGPKEADHATPSSSSGTGPHPGA